MEEKQKPDNKFKAGAVTATVWANEMKDRQGNKFSVYTVAFERNYKDRDGNWKSTNSLRVNDIPKLQSYHLRQSRRLETLRAPQRG